MMAKENITVEIVFSDEANALLEEILELLREMKEREISSDEMRDIMAMGGA